MDIFDMFFGGGGGRGGFSALCSSGFRPECGRSFRVAFQAEEDEVGIDVAKTLFISCR